jgi:hypothetical protein
MRALKKPSKRATLSAVVAIKRPVWGRIPPGIFFEIIRLPHSFDVPHRMTKETKQTNCDDATD